MANKIENKFNEYVLHIGSLVRTITLTPYDWGISVVVEDRNIQYKNSLFKSRNFHYTEKYKTTEQLFRRIKKYYRMHH